MNIPVSLSEMKISKKKDDTLVARNVGTGLGLAAHDPVTGVSGLYHIMLPSAQVYPGLAQKKPLMFADTGIPLFIRALCEQGVKTEHLQIELAGGADLIPTGRNIFSVGQENIRKAFECLRASGLTVQEHGVGGKRSRAIFINVGSGKTWVSEN